MDRSLFLRGGGELDCLFFLLLGGSCTISWGRLGGGGGGGGGSSSVWGGGGGGGIPDRRFDRVKEAASIIIMYAVIL